MYTGHEKRQLLGKSLCSGRLDRVAQRYFTSEEWKELDHHLSIQRTTKTGKILVLPVVTVIL